MARIAALEGLLESKEASSEERARELRRHGAEVAQLEEELRREEARTQDEAETSARLNEETDELRREAQEAALNLEVVEQQAKAADARVAELQDQKRLLVREVKNARKALSDAEAANRAVLERALAEAPPEVKRDTSEDEVERGPFTDEKPAFVVTCKRCGGDVAGPKNSTCVCSVPLLGEEGPSQIDKASTEARRVWRSMTKSLFSSAAAPPPPPKAPDDAPEAETPPPAARR